MKINKFLFFQLTVLLLFSCGNKSSSITEEARKVRAASAVTREIPDTANGFGSLSFLSKVDITSAQEAVIKKLYFREGDFVSEGSLLILLENPQINLAVKRAENNLSHALAARNLAGSRLLEGMFQAEAQLHTLDKAGAELALVRRRWEENNRKHLNQETLYSAGGIHTEAILVSRFNVDTEWEQIMLMERELDIRRIGSRDKDLEKAGIPVPLSAIEKQDALVSLITASLFAELEAAEARLEAAEKELASANIALSELTIRSSTSGIVGARYLEEGERVKPQDKIISLIDISSLYAIFPVRERDAMRMEKGMTASVFIDGTGETRDGIVDLIYPQADSQSLSFLARVLLQNGSDSETGINMPSMLMPGMFARVTVNLGPSKTAVFIPDSAVFNQRNNEGSIFIINGSVLAERKITLGSSRGDEREAASGLNPGELFVLRPDSDFREGLNVTIAE
ncbi:MAG: efflux RND transporter periplasmic adaptor subunit [Treponema sp.]|nr:efflux RND transporter periplasmic adaptor subunit [Treponema sp.]